MVVKVVVDGCEGGCNDCEGVCEDCDDCVIGVGCLYVCKLECEVD